MDKQPGPFRKEDFIAWLRSMPEEYIVGRAGSWCKCPYAKYLTTSLGLSHVTVSTTVIEWGSMIQRRRCHPWLIGFIRAVDAIKPHESYVTAGRCLRILEVA